jgi:hypothetical protein
MSLSMIKKIFSSTLLPQTGAGVAAGKVKYPGVRDAVDGNTAVIHVERESSDAAGAYPITPSTQMGEYWAEEVAKGHLNISNKPLIFIEPESEHAAAGVTAGMAMTGLRASNFSSAQGVAFMHESLYAAVGKRLPYVLNMGCRAITKASLNVHAGHDDYHCVDDTGFIQMMAKNATEAADLNLIGRKLAELSLTPAIIGQDGFLTSHLIESCVLPERELVAEFCGKPDDMIDSPTPAQQMLYGPKRRRVPAIWDVDLPLLVGLGAEPGRLHAGHGRPAPVFFRSRRGPGRRLHGRVRFPYRARLPARVGFQDRGCRLRHPRHGQHDRAGRGRRRLPARDAQAESRRGQSDHVPPLPRRPAGPRTARQERRRWCWSAPTSRWRKTCR